MNSESTRRGKTTPRRRFLAGAASSVALATAGCAGGSSEPDENSGTDPDDAPVVVASFFTFYDFARQIAAGTPVRVHNLVPVGLHGHGWEPDPSITRDIIDADAFVHVGEGFQPWADRAIQTVRDDDAGTHLIDAREGIDLLDLADTLEEDEQVGEGKDPHFWLDPIRAKSAVDNVSRGLSETFPEYEGNFLENAQTLNETLETLDDRWRRVFDDAQREVVFLAAHNAFEYVGDRYGAKIQPLVTNLAATDDVRPADMRRAQDTIADNDIRFIGAAIFEPRRPAKQLLEETAVEAYYPVTPYAGTRREWVDRGWGYLEIARNINVPTFEIVLGSATPEETGLGDEWRNFE